MGVGVNGLQYAFKSVNSRVDAVLKMVDKVRKEVRERLARMLDQASSSKEVTNHIEGLRELAAQSADEKGMRRLSTVFKALGDQKRLSILDLINVREMCVCEIMAALKVTQPTASHHLGILERAGLVKERREGRWVFYSLTSPEIIRLVELAERLSS